MISDKMKEAVSELLKIEDREKRLIALKQYLSGFDAYFKSKGTDYTYVATQIYLNEFK